jgi:hypothetical protein
MALPIATTIGWTGLRSVRERSNGAFDQETRDSDA